MAELLRGDAAALRGETACGDEVAPVASEPETDSGEAPPLPPPGTRMARNRSCRGAPRAARSASTTCLYARPSIGAPLTATSASPARRAAAAALLLATGGNDLTRSIPAVNSKVTPSGPSAGNSTVSAVSRSRCGLLPPPATASVLAGDWSRS